MRTHTNNYYGVDANGINRQLKDYGGIDTITTHAMWRISWCDDEYEKMLTDYVNGVALLRPEVRECPKYPHLKGKYVLEHLVAVPDISMPELPACKISYEPIHVFENKHDEPMIPSFRACKFVIDTVHTAMGSPGSNMNKYVDPENNQENAIQHKTDTINGIIEELFGEQSALQGTTKTGESVAYTGPTKI